MSDLALLKKRIREMKPDDGRRRDCYICGNYKHITHCHHVIPVWQIAEVCERWDFFYVLFPITFVWLCPNHHEIYHLLYGGSKKSMDERLAIIDLLAEGEFERYGDLSNLESKCWEEFEKRLDMVKEYDESYVIDYIVEVFHENQDS